MKMRKGKENKNYALYKFETRVYNGAITQNNLVLKFGAPKSSQHVLPFLPLMVDLKFSKIVNIAIAHMPKISFLCMCR